ncbi:hypothetical protein NOR_05772 [Metarhizium rileyi]|uniref:Uncharacterized protein n=1 Tax=Metarhizium rileyi (strain RCEF 4871) TaxID=1649241 RepID=A0A167C1X0_METRR|nr:hypothetical protein NOR_05772 [Metarhizium rileyi RCEF 4871]
MSGRNAARDGSSETSIVISGFPAVGKTWLASHGPQDYTVVDLDTANWPLETRGDDFFDKYVEMVRELAQKSRHIILVSSHQETRTALAKASVPYSLVYPSAHLKDEYVRRVENRGSGELASRINDNWTVIIDSVQDQKDCEHFVLTEGQYLGGIIFVIINRSRSNHNQKTF